MSNGEEPDPLPEKFWVETRRDGPYYTDPDGSKAYEPWPDPIPDEWDGPGVGPWLPFPAGFKDYRWSQIGSASDLVRIAYVHTTAEGKTALLSDPDVSEIGDPRTYNQPFTTAQRDLAEVLAQRDFNRPLPAHINTPAEFCFWCLAILYPRQPAGRTLAYYER